MPSTADNFFHPTPTPWTHNPPARPPTLPYPIRPTTDSPTLPLADPAIEQGGGFFVPGLEETWKIQVGVSLIVLFLLLTNRFPWVYEPSGPQLISEGVGLIAALSLLGGGVLGSGVFDGFLGGGEVDGSGGGGASASGGDNTSGVGFGRVSFAAPELEARDLAAAENCLWAGNALLDLTNSQAALLLDSTGRPMACVGEYERSHAWFSDSQALSGRAVEFEFVGGGAVQLDANDAGRSGLRELLPSGCAFVASQGGGEGGWLVASPAKGRWSARQMGWLESIAGFTKEQLGE